MKIKILLFLLFAMFLLPAFPQPMQPGIQFYYSEINALTADDEALIYFTYRVPYNRLVFEKEGEQYFAGYMLSVEVFDSGTSFISRQIIDDKLSVELFEETNSNTSFNEGVMTFKLPKGTYKFIPVFTDLRSNKEIRPPVLTINTLSNKAVLPLIVVDAEKAECKGEYLYRITNYNGAVPFGESEYNIIIPAADSLESIFVLIKSGSDTVYKGSINDSYISSFDIIKCGDNVVISSNPDDKKIKYFVLKDFSRKLKEGDLTLYISEKEDKKPLIFNKEVRWFNKPFSLRNTEEAIRLLRFVEEERIVKDLLNSDNFDTALALYWEKYDPTPNTVFNPLMNEFYARADFAARNFSSLNGRSGVETDRGKVFLQFGKPRKIERSSNEYGKVIETWYYENPQRIFSFIDERGTGEFSLKNG